MYVNDKEYKYSYLLLKEPYEYMGICEGHKHSMGEWTLISSDDMDIHTYSHMENEIVLLGYILDIRNAGLGVEDILKHLLYSEDILDELEYMNGRFIALLKKGPQMYLYTDASAMLPVNYCKDEGILSSHDIIIKEILESNGISVDEYEQHANGILDLTRFKNIYKFNPSMRLNMSTMKFDRIYPRYEREVIKSSEALDRLKPYFQEMIKWLKKWEGEMILTLTGGYDSRVSMALTNELSDRIEYLTYLSGNKDRMTERAREIYEIDEYIVKEITRNFKIKHSLINLERFDLTGTEREELKLKLQSSHSFPLLAYFRHNRKLHRALHIKSTIFGMGKADFPLTRNQQPLKIAEMVGFVHGVPSWFKARSDYDIILREYLKRNDHHEGVSLGRHYHDIFHLESRMGNWHSNITQETDPELIEFVFVNSRKVLELLQSPSLYERKNKVLYKRIIHEYWPALLYLGFNEKEASYDQKKLGMEEEFFISNLNVIDLHGMDVSSTKGTITFMPVDENIHPRNLYRAEIKNNSTKPASLHLKSAFQKEAGRGYINVKIITEDHTTMDMVDLAKGYPMELAPFETFVFQIEYTRPFDKLSWQKAGRLIINY